MPKKSAASADKETKKKPAKKAAPAAKKPAAAKKKPAVEKPVEKSAVAKPVEKTAVTKVKAATAPAAKPKRASRRKGDIEDIPATVKPPITGPMETADWSPRASAAPATPVEPAPVAPAPVATAVTTELPQPAQKPRPLYIPREVEAFLLAARIPVPTDKQQLDAILSAMSAARAAAHAATSGNASAQVRPPQQPQRQQPPQQPGQPADAPQNHGGQQNPQQPRMSRRERERERQRERFERRQREREQQQQQPQDGQPQQESAEQQAHHRDPRPDEAVEIVEAEGYCEIAGKGFGFIRDLKRAFIPNPMDVFVMPEIVKRFGLRDGHWLKCEAKKSSRGMQIHKLISVNDQPPDNVKTWQSFEDCTTINPIERFNLETDPDRTTTRVMDLMIPIGKGQRGLIVAPPRTGKTTLLHHIADAIIKNHPEVKLMILLVDERPEEVTDFRRSVPEAELWASSNDMEVKSHTRIATLAAERARRLVESGSDVFILLDSITRLGRAFNNALAGGGRTMSGGVDARALEIPRKIFAAARNTEEAGSLTIVATALIETGSRMDELIFQEFKGTGNSEVVLDRLISNQRIYPAIDMFQSGTRREELIVPADQLQKINTIRRGLAGHKPIEAIERVLSILKRFPTNEQLLKEIPG